MNKGVAIAFGLLLVGAAVGVILFNTRHNRLELDGKILQVRSHQIDNENTVAIVDFRISNPSTQQFLVKEVEVFVDDASADTFSEIDARRLFEHYRVLGDKHNATLVRRDKIDSGAQIDRMIAIRFPGPDAKFQQRKQIRIVVQDADRAKREILERR